MRTAGQVSTFDDFTLRFVSAEDFKPRTLEQNEKLLCETASKVQIPTFEELSVFDRNNDCELETDWLLSAKTEIFVGQRYGQSEMIDQPVCFLYVVSTSELNPLKSLEQMIQHGKVAETFSGQFSGSIPRFYLLLHDAATTVQSDTEVTKTFDKMQRLYSIGSRQQTRTFCVKINSRSLTAAADAIAAGRSESEVQQDIAQHRRKVLDLWNLTSTEGEQKNVKGERLSQVDVRNLRNFTIDFVQNGLFPALEQFTAQLNAGIEKEKKGLKNALRSWWKKPKAETIKAGQLQYVSTDIVSKVRTLADLSFMFR